MQGPVERSDGRGSAKERKGPIEIARQPTAGDAVQDESSFFRSWRPLPRDLSTFVATRVQETDAMHNPTLAYALSLISGWAYADHDTIHKQLGYNGVDADITFIESANNAMLLVARAYFLRWRSGRLGVLAFRGTEPQNIISWLTDTNSTMSPFPYSGASTIHSGFLENTAVIWDDIEKVLEGALDNRKPEGLTVAVRPQDAPETYDHPLESLYITGHSLGGAMAVVAAATLLNDRNPGRARDWDRALRGIYTYGQPMVGDAAFRDKYEPRFKNRLFRHVFDADLVPRMPPATVGNFVHFGQRLFSQARTQPWRDENGADQASSLIKTGLSVAASFVVRRVNAGPAWLPRLLLPRLIYSIDDHVPTNYIQVGLSSVR